MSNHVRRRCIAMMIAVAANTILAGLTLYDYRLTDSTSVLADTLESVVNIFPTGFVLYAASRGRGAAKLLGSPGRWEACVCRCGDIDRSHGGASGCKMDGAAVDRHRMSGGFGAVYRMGGLRASSKWRGKAHVRV